MISNTHQETEGLIEQADRQGQGPEPGDRRPAGIVPLHAAAVPDRSAAAPSPESRERLRSDWAVLLTVQQVADRLGMSWSWVYPNLIDSGALPSVRLGSSRRVKLADFERFIDTYPTDEPA